MVDILQYRAHIGLFRQKSKNFKFLYVSKFYMAASWNENKSGEIVFNTIKSLLKILILSILMTQVSDDYPSLLLRYRSEGCDGGSSPTSALVSTESWYRYSVATQSWCFYTVATQSGFRYRDVCSLATYNTGQHGKYTGNFWARYTYGNARVKVMGFKICILISGL